MDDNTKYILDKLVVMAMIAAPAVLLWIKAKATESAAKAALMAAQAAKLEAERGVAQRKLIVAKVDEIHRNTDGLVDRLVNATKESSHAAGVKEEQDRSANQPR